MEDERCRSKALPARSYIPIVQRSLQSRTENRSERNVSGVDDYR